MLALFASGCATVAPILFVADDFPILTGILFGIIKNGELAALTFAFFTGAAPNALRSFTLASIAHVLGSRGTNPTVALTYPAGNVHLGIFGGRLAVTQAASVRFDAYRALGTFVRTAFT